MLKKREEREKEGGRETGRERGEREREREREKQRRKERKKEARFQTLGKNGPTKFANPSLNLLECPMPYILKLTS